TPSLLFFFTYQLQMSTLVISFLPDSTSSFLTSGTFRKPATSAGVSSSHADLAFGPGGPLAIIFCALERARASLLCAGLLQAVTANIDSMRAIVSGRTWSLRCY